MSGSKARAVRSTSVSMSRAPMRPMTARTPMTLRTCLYPLWTLPLLGMICALAHFQALAVDLRASDDNLWMYYAGVNLAYRQAGDNLNAELIELLDHSG